jgi:hypothetical protein
VIAQLWTGVAGSAVSARGLLVPSLMARRAKLAGLAMVAVVSVAACAPAPARVDAALQRAGSWSATVKVVTEQWAQSRVSLRFTRTTLTTATTELARDADSIRSVDGTAAARIERLKNAIAPVLAAVAINEPDQARDAAARLTTIITPGPSAP